jgi:hypothetical protein
VKDTLTLWEHSLSFPAPPNEKGRHADENADPFGLRLVLHQVGSPAYMAEMPAVYTTLSTHSSMFCFEN